MGSGIHILYIDTATDVASIAISSNHKLVVLRTSEESRNHAATINGMIDETMKEAGLQFKELSAVAVCAGPGSYTGLRIGLSTAKGLCYVLDKPLMMYNKLDLLCRQNINKDNKKYEHFVAILRAREGEYFVSAHAKNLDIVIEAKHVMAEEIVSSIGKLASVCLITECDDVNWNAMITNLVQIEKNIKIDFGEWVKWGEADYIEKKFAHLANCEPDYLKDVYTHK